MALALAAIGILCAGYGVTIMLVWSGSQFFVVWYVLGAACLLWAWAVRSGAWAAAPGILRALVTALALAFCLAAGGLSAIAMSRARAVALPGADYLVVLGAQVKPDGTPSTVLQYRLDRAVSYLRTSPATTVVVSGGQGTNEPTSEAACMAAYLQDQGIAPERILLEDESENTTANIANTLALVEAREPTLAGLRIAVCTNDFHVWRALAIARKAGVPQPEGLAAGSVPWYLPNNLLRECFGIAKDRLCGNL